MHFNPEYMRIAAGLDLLQGDPSCYGGGFAVTIDGVSQLAVNLTDLRMPTLLGEEGDYDREHLTKGVVAKVREFDNR